MAVVLNVLCCPHLYQQDSLLAVLPALILYDAVRKNGWEGRVLGGFLGAAWTRSWPPQHIVRVSLTIVTLAAGYAHIAWLMSGTYAITRGRPVPRRWKRGMLGFCLLAGVILATLFTSDPALGSARFFTRFGLRAGAAAVAYLSAGVWLSWRGGWRHGLGRAIVIGAFLLYGVEQLNYFVRISLELLGVATMGADFALFGLLDFLLQFAMGLGMVIWLLEDERDELGRTADALQRSEERLWRSQRLEAVGQLAGGVAHDFNNLLTVITGRGQRLLRSLEAGTDDWEEARQIDESAQRGATLVRQLLAFSRRQVLAPRHVDVNEVVAAVKTMLDRSLGEDIRLETDLAADLGWVRVDPAQMEHVLVNLALNARDAMPDGGILTIATRNVDVAIDIADSISGLAPGEHIELTVQDTGVGMDDETRRHMFEPFYTTKEVGKGSGLGLATVYGVVRQSHGSTVVESTPGFGTTIKVFLPRVEAPDESEAALAPDQGAEPAAATSGITEAAAAAGGKGTILVAEDEEHIRGLLIAVLQDNGYEVIVASNGVEALELIEENGKKIDLLLTDVVMPEMGGPELADELEARNPGLKVVFMSGYSEEIVGSRLSAEHRVLLEKPFSLPTLLDRVRSAMEG
ncbi:MAG: response regulator [Acidobacteria bacterium]|nr:response regulator [Acidobacteriota bacterium]